VRRWLGHYQALLHGIVHQSGRPVLELPLIEETAEPAPA
jgi:hypothetical protein